MGERHDLQRPGRLQQAASVRAQRNAEGGQGGAAIVINTITNTNTNTSELNAMRKEGKVEHQLLYREIDTCYEKGG